MVSYGRQISIDYIVLPHFAEINYRESCENTRIRLPRGYRRLSVYKPDSHLSRILIFLKSRNVPFKLLPLIEKELENLVKDGILEKVNSSEWATPIVPVLKKNNAFCRRVVLDTGKRGNIFENRFASVIFTIRSLPRR